MNILLINHYAGSPTYGMEYRPYYLAREWVRSGHDVEILAASYSHVRSRQPDVASGSNRRSAVEIIDGIRYRWFSSSPYKGNGVGRVLNIAQFLAGVARDSRVIVRERRPDVVIASSTYPIDIWVASRIAKIAKAKLIYEVHDIWPLSLVEVGGMSRHHPFVFLCGIAEKAAYKKSDLVVSMLPKVHSHMAARGLDLDRLEIVPNGIALEEWSSSPDGLQGQARDVIAGIRSRGRYVVGYAGSHGVPNALDVLLDAAKLLREQDSIEIVMVGDGHEKQRLAKRVADERIGGVHMLPPIPKSQIPVFLNSIDVAYIGWQRSSIYRFGIAPNKLMDYMMSGCVVLHSVDAGNDPVAESECGLSVAPDSARLVAEGLRALTGISASRRKEMGDRGRAYVVANHTYKVLAERFISAMNRTNRRE